MFIDARTLSDVASVDCDVCVIGAGAAGITLARELAGHAVRVCLIESGDLEIDVATQELYEGENVGLPYHPLAVARLRYFGGTTNHWSGQCLPFSASDFEAQPWLPDTGWPIDLAEVMPYYQRAAAMLGLPEGGWDAGFWADEFDRTMIEFDPLRFLTKVFLVKPVHMGEAYRQEILEAENIQAYLNANVVEIETNDTASEVSQVRVQTLAGNGFSVVAKHFVLAVGGIENPRLLLSSDAVQPGGLGNQHDLVGRFFLEHPFFMGGAIQPSSPGVPTWFYSGNTRPNTDVRPYLLLADEVQRDEQLVATGVSLIPIAEEAYWAKGAKSLRLLGRQLAGAKMPDDLALHVGNVASDLGSVTELAYKWVRYGQVPIARIDCRVAITPAPNPDSRVTLGHERDALGLRRVELDWRLSPIDKQSARRTMELLGLEVGRLELGRLQSTIDDDDTTWPDDLEGAFHHAGTTRMADDPGKGVVDRHCRVHGISNLYVAGSSVFPTAGVATPTFLIIALAIRLADHIKGLS